MFLFPKNAHQQSVLECRNLAFAIWSLLLLQLQAKYQRPARGDCLSGRFAPSTELANICAGQSAIAKLIRNGSSGEPIPKELTLNILIQLAADLKADLWLKCTRPNGQFRQCLFIRSRTLHAQLSELLPADSCSRLVLVEENHGVWDAGFETLFGLAADAGYKLTIRLLFDNQTVPGAGFYRRYPQLKPLFNRHVREQSATRRI
jgi:hypothetical protein